MWVIIKSKIVVLSGLSAKNAKLAGVYVWPMQIWQETYRDNRTPPRQIQRSVLSYTQVPPLFNNIFNFCRCLPPLLVRLSHSFISGGSPLKFGASSPDLLYATVYVTSFSSPIGGRYWRFPWERDGAAREHTQSGSDMVRPRAKF